MHAFFFSGPSHFSLFPLLTIFLITETILWTPPSHQFLLTDNQVLLIFYTKTAFMIALLLQRFNLINILVTAE